MLVLAVTSLKGGVGKTSVTLGLASAALEYGLTTLVVDMDPQGDATMALQPMPAAAAVADVLADPTPTTVHAAISASTWVDAGLDVIIGTERSIEHDKPGEHIGNLRTALGTTSGYDMAIIDCPPSLGALTRTGLTAADRALVVTEPGLFAVMAVARALRTIDELRREQAPTLQPLGIVVNRVRSRSTEQTYRLAELDQMYGPLVLSPTIPERAALQQAQGAARPIHAWPGNPAHELSTAFDTLLERALRTTRREAA
ncbi:MAG: ParA family protein [Micrococcales bacterium]|nr:ParA family protein [Micrococcales bacterium]MCL2666809.1 ParA family protein [Micrococcales bacterium]